MPYQPTMLATQAGYDILEDGGNAVDAGVAAGIALAVVQSDIVNVGGVAPMIFYLTEKNELTTISGLGWWPRTALGAKGHKVEWWPEITRKAGAVCAIVHDREAGQLAGGADPRRQARGMAMERHGENVSGGTVQSNGDRLWPAAANG